MCKAGQFRRRFGAVSISAALAGGIGLGGLACGKNLENVDAKSSAPRPNVVFILADDLGYGDLSCLGQTNFTTPNIDRLASSGMILTSHYAGAPVSAPSRCVLMTGQHTGHATIRHNRAKGIKLPKGQELAIHPEQITLGEVMHNAGYQTTAIGKWGLGSPTSDSAAHKQGFDSFFGYRSQGEAHFYYPPILVENDRNITYKNNLGNEGDVYSHDLFETRALDYIRERDKAKPFFMYLALTLPHASLDVPEEYSKPYENEFTGKPYKGRHYKSHEKPFPVFIGMIQRLDKTVGLIIDELEKQGISQNTIIVLTSDNGPHKEGGADPEFFNSNGEYEGIKRDLLEGGIRMPTIVSWPNTISANTKSDVPSAFWDWMPTFCDITSQQVPDAVDGQSLIPVFAGQKPKSLSQRPLYWEFYYTHGGQQAVRIGHWKGYRKNISKDPNSPWQLFDLNNDPQEQNDLSKQYPDIVKQITEVAKREHTPNKYWQIKTTE
ncbi:arylsulfatase [Planctomycetota bacterium]|nr:arylsulfatase [Planctomycetota bacterium]